MTGVTGSTEERALALLGSGIDATQVAHALNVSESRISQLLSQDSFAAEVALRRYNNLLSQTDRDSRYEDLEDILIDKLKQSIGCLFQPMQIARVLQMVNATKRRGAATIGSTGELQRSTVVQLNLPTIIRNTFVTNIQNQVVVAGDKDLVTMQPKTLLDAVRARDRGKPNEDVIRKRVAEITGSSERTASA